MERDAVARLSLKKKCRKKGREEIEGVGIGGIVAESWTTTTATTTTTTKKREKCLRAPLAATTKPVVVVSRDLWERLGTSGRRDLRPVGV